MGFGQGTAQWREDRLGQGRFLVVEGILSILGFPGIGWMYGGYPRIGLALITLGPAALWIGIPVLGSVHALGALPGGLLASFGYLILSTMCSVGGLRISLVCRSGRPAEQPAGPGSAGAAGGSLERKPADC